MVKDQLVLVIDAGGKMGERAREGVVCGWEDVKGAEREGGGGGGAVTGGCKRIELRVKIREESNEKRERLKKERRNGNCKTKRQVSNRAREGKTSMRTGGQEQKRKAERD